MRNSIRFLRNPLFWLVLFIIGTILLAYLSLLKAPTVPIGFDVRNRMAHFLAYLAYGMVLSMWRFASAPDAMRQRIYLQAAVPSCVYGIILEWLQMYLPYRDADPLDGLCNVLGALIGPAVVLAVLARGRKSSAA
jgi:VanZ family protein